MSTKYMLLVVLFCLSSAVAVLQKQMYNSASMQAMTMVNHSKNLRKRSNAGGDSDLPLASSCPPWFLADQPMDMSHDNDLIIL